MKHSGTKTDSFPPTDSPGTACYNPEVGNSTEDMCYKTPSKRIGRVLGRPKSQISGLIPPGYVSKDGTGGNKEDNLG